ncbi:MAG: phosphomannomutase/phosphoglucomutase, partial [Bacilli bacterium]|nr:phosphomannomutase/phosphoglucomutase [Bacilli bacterium]
MELVKINERIFREYDIRGIYGEDLSSDVAYTLGRSYGTFMKRYQQDTVIVGHDNRTSSPILNEAFIQGVNDSGSNVIDLGLVTTPMFYFARKYFQIPTGVMITASHNPSEYNGFKTSFEPIGNAYGELIKEFGIFTNEHKFDTGEGTKKTFNIHDEYLKLINNSISLGTWKPKVVVDLGNGTASVIVKDALEMLGLEYVILNEKKDLSQRTEYLDPSIKDKMVELSNKVKELGYDIGIGLDGDADRIGIVASNGYILGAEEYMIIMYRYLNNKLKNRKALFDVKCGYSLIDELKKLDILPVMNRTGNSYQNKAMQEGDFDFGGEYSGHVFFRDKWIGSDDGLYGGLRMIEVMSNTNKPLTELLEGIEKVYGSPEIKVKVTDENKFDIVNKVKEEALNKGYKIIDIDGVRIELENT